MSIKDAVKVTKKSVAILASDRAVITVIPKAWAVTEKKKKEVKNTKKWKPNTSYRILPSSQYYKRIIVPAIATGCIVGSGGHNLYKLLKDYPEADLYYFLKTGKTGVWV